MRAFRPSHYAPADAYEEDDQRAKDANMQVYTERAEMGAPLFEGVPGIVEMTVRTPDFRVRE